MDKDICASLQALRDVIARLTGPGGCQWDMAQTPRTLADYMIEECHELVAAIRFGDTESVRDEMGDVVFLLLFICACYEREGKFSLADALDSSREKMIRRHPHVFGNAHFENIDSHLQAWEAIKKKEHEGKGPAEGLFAILPQSLPPLIKAYRIHSKAARAGFSWPEDEEVEQQVESEWLEWLDASANGDDAARMHEMGDMLFSLVELGRRKGIKASEALDLATDRFLRRYAGMEKLAKSQGHDLSELSLDEKDELWNQVKAAEHPAG